MLQTRNDLSWLTIDQWQSHVESHPKSSVFHHRNWLETLSEQYRLDVKIPAIVASGQVQAAIPFLQTRSLRGRRKLISLPFTDYLTTLDGDRPAFADLTDLIQNELRGKIQTVVIRSDQCLPTQANVSHNVRHELVTTRPMQEIQSKFANAINRNLRKARRMDLQFQKRDDSEGLEIFYRLHVLTRRKLGVPVQPKSFFRQLDEKLIKRGLGFIGVVTKENDPIAAVVLLHFNRQLVYKYAASHPAALEHRPNDWLVYNAICIAVDEDYRCFDFGISDKSQQGLRRFKSKWGATESDVFHSYVLGEPDSHHEPSWARRVVADVIKRTPTIVCRSLGTAFYKYSQ